MNFKLPFWKFATALIVLTLICNPVLIELALLIDLVGLDVFLIVIELQFVALIGYHFNMWVKPTLKIVYSTIQKFDPYFFLPTKSIVKQYPLILCHAIPELMVLSFGVLVIPMDSSTA